MESYYRETGGTRELLTKERKGLFSGQDTFLGGQGGKGIAGILSNSWPLPLGGRGGNGLGPRDRGCHWC